MKRVWLGSVLCGLGGGLLAAALVYLPLGGRSFAETSAIGMIATTAALLLISGTLVLLSTVGRGKTGALLRLDHFLPFLRKKKQKETLRPPSLAVRMAKRLLPASFFSDPLTGKPGRGRRFARQAHFPTETSDPFGLAPDK